ncbi:DUF7221 family queuine tRNA-ribosyltransferase-like protein [Cupriavidus sp. TMH.W2]|uniref:deazapurine DNA modification protein DpdA family protein n=1 Tax=Cupriavidus sp. TMH.W2 TaxID=3434465 RepID=UPI003D76CB67
MEMVREMMGLPVEQGNAVLDDGLVMRVGIPHKGGKLAFHAFNEGFPVMVSANAFWQPATQSFQFPQATDLSELDFAMDSAGYTAMKMWQAKGTQRGMAGVFPWTYEQYIEFATLCGASWWSQPDLCCEPEIAHNQEEIDFRINATATLLEGVLRVLYEWQNQLAKTCSASVVASMLRPPVPVVQGWSVSDYERSLDLLNAVWERWQPWLAAPALIGVGSVCRRNLKHPKHGLFAVLAALEGKLPKGSRLHLFGVKGAALSEVKMLDWVASVDSMAYDFGARIKARESGISNSIAHRSSEMSRWMSAAANRMRPIPGDQFRLNLFG